MDTIDFRLKIIFLTPVLGAQPTTEIASEYLARKAGFELRPEDEELLPDVLERGTTVFHRLPGTDTPCLMNYQVLGFLKESGRVQNGKINGLKNLRAKVAQQVFVTPRHLPIKGDFEIDMLERPLRADTPFGPKVVLARSEMIAEGVEISCGLQVLAGADIRKEVLESLLDYGYYRGIGPWRGSGAYGTFRYELVQE